MCSIPSSVSRRSALIVAAMAAVALGCGWAGTSKATISGGFSNSGNWVLNGNSTFVPFISGGDLTLTTGQNGENTSAWYTTQQDVGASWTANFTWQVSVPSNPPADGFMFVVQGAGTSALGGGGGSKGYENPAPTGFTDVSPSVGMGVELFGTPSGGGLDLGINGQFASDVGLPAASTLNLQTDANPINFTISYYAPAHAISVSAVDSTNSADSLTYTTYGPTSSLGLLGPPGINVANTLGSNSAYVGFTGATGGFNMEQDFTNFSFANSAPTIAPPPSTPAYILTARSPVALTAGSFNADNVVENTVSLTSSAIPSNVATPVGSFNTFYEAGLSVGGTVQSGGLPTSHQFVSQADGVTTFQLQHYTNTNNVLHLNSGGITSGTMTLSTPTAFTTLAILAVSTNAGSNTGGTVTLNFANGQTVTTDYGAPDWFSNTSGTTPDGNRFAIALAGIGRIAVTNSSVSGLPNEPDLYETVLNLADLGVNGGGTVNMSGHVLDSLTFNLNPSTFSTDIFSVSGSAVPEPAPLVVLASGTVGILFLRRRKLKYSGKC